MAFRLLRGLCRRSSLTRARSARRSLRVLWCAAALWTWGAWTAWALEKPNLPVYSLPTVTVEASRLVDDEGFGRLDFSGTGTPRVFSLAERLEELPGVHLIRRGCGLPDNQDDAVVVRGFDARRYVLVLNDHPVGMSGVMGGSRVDWDLLPPFADDSVVFDHSGRGSTPHGALGGVIRMITTSPVRRTGRFLWETGPFNAERRVFDYGDVHGAFGYRLYLGNSRNDGFLKNQDRDQDRRAGRIFYNDPHGWDSLEFGWSNIQEDRGYAVANRPTNKSFDPAFPVSDGERINPGDFVASSGSTLHRTLDFMDFTWRRSVGEGQWSAGLSRSREKRHDIICNASRSTIIDRSIESDNSDYLFLQREGKTGNNHWRFGIDQRHLRYGDGSYRTAPPNAMLLYASQKSDLTGVFGEWRKRLKAGELELTFRQQWFKGEADDDRAGVMRSLEHVALIPQLAWSWETKGGWQHRLSWRRLWRAPSMAEYYWWSANYSTPARIGSGKTLQPEDGNGFGYDLERSFGPGRALLASFYRNDLQDYIHFVHAFPFSCYNIARVRVQGLEWSWRQKLNKGTTVQVGHTWQETERRGVDSGDARNGLPNELDYRPRHQWQCKLSYQDRWWGFTHTLRYVGAQRASFNPTPFKQEVVTLAPFVVQDVNVSLRWTKQTTWSLHVNNLADKEYSEQAGFPMPGRTIWLQVEQLLF
ncbi:MAG: hypothetical protein WA705_22815 [Candidatus Ozemobacteraceae bacterium]